MANNDIGMLGGKALAAALVGHPVLESLDLSYNFISDVGFTAFVRLGRTFL